MRNGIETKTIYAIHLSNFFSAACRNNPVKYFYVFNSMKRVRKTKPQIIIIASHQVLPLWECIRKHKRIFIDGNDIIRNF